jgi:hypothetical protein
MLLAIELTVTLANVIVVPSDKVKLDPVAPAIAAFVWATP